VEKEILKSLNDVKLWFATHDCSKLAFDTETTSLKWDDMQIVGISFCNGDSACYIDLIQFINDSSSESFKIINFLQKKFKYDIKKLIAHNMPFDLKVLSKLPIMNNGYISDKGIVEVTNRIFCTQTAAHLINENQSKKLKYLAYKYLNIPQNEIKEWEQVNSDYHSEEFYKYALNDAIWTWQLYEIFNKELVWQGLDKLFFEIEMPFQFVLRDLEIKGVLVDQDRIVECKKELQKVLFDLKLKLVKAAGLKYGIQCNLFDDSKEILTANLNSPKQLVDIIAKRLGLEITEKTPGGKLSVGKLSMLKLKGKHEFIDLLDKYKKARKLYDAFVEPFPNHICKDGRVRTSFHNTVAVTGRLSSSGPNLQQLPKSSEPIDLRSCFIAPKGKKLIVADYCFDKETEVLTKKGWIKFPDLPKNVQIAQWFNGKITYAKPLAYQRKWFYGNMVQIKGDRQIDLCMTPNHRCLLINKKSGELHLKLANDYPVGSHLSQIQSGLWQGSKQESFPFLQVVAAIQADGKVRKNDYIVWLKKERKIERLRKLLLKAGIPFMEQHCNKKVAGHAFKIKKELKFLNYLSEDKTFDRENLIKLESEDRNIFLDELEFWDGCRKQHLYCSTNLKNCEIVQELAVLTERRANLVIRYRSDRKPCGQVTLNKKTSTYIKTIQKEFIPYNDLTYCVTMPASTVIVRRNGKVSVTGNSGQELRGLAEVSKDGNLIQAFEKGYDLHLRTANNIFNLGISDSRMVDNHPDYKELRKKYDKERHIGKNGVNFPIVYGKTAYGLSLDFNISIAKAQKWLDGFLDLYPNVRKAMTETKQEVIRRKEVRTLFGRKRRFTDITNKSFRQAFNVKIQSYCADLMRLVAAKLLELCKGNPKWGLKIILLIHDEFVFECNDKYVKKAILQIKDVMENAVKICVDLPVDINYGQNYSETK